MPVIDSLEIDIQSKSESVNKSLEELIRKLGVVADGISAIGKIDTLDGFAKKAAEVTKGLSNISNVAKGISGSMAPVSKSIEQIVAQYANLGKGFTFKGSTAEIQKQIDKYTNSLEAAKLKKEELETAGKTEGKAYEAAIARTIKYENVVESLKLQLTDLQTAQPNLNFDISGIEETRQAIESVGESLRGFASIPASAFNYNADAMIAVFGEAAGNIQNYAQAIEQFGMNAGMVLNSSPQLRQLNEESQAAAEGIRVLGERLSHLTVPEICEENLKKLQSELNKTEIKLDDLRVNLENGLTMGIISESIDSSGYVRLQEQIALTEKQAEALRAKIAEVENQSGGGRRIERFAAILENLSSVGKTAKSALSGVTSVLGKFDSVVKNAISGMLKLAKSISGVRKSSKTTSVSLAGEFKTVLKYAFGIRSLYVLVNKLRTAMVDAFKNLAQYSSQTNTSLSMAQSSLGALKNSLAAAFAPIVDVIAPYLSMFIDMLTKAFNAVGRLFAALSGKSFAVQAVKNFSDYAAGISKAGSAAKKAGKDAQQGTRAFDELKTISINKDEGADGEGGGVEISPADMFTTVPIEGAIKEFASKLSGTLGNAFDTFGQAWKSKGLSVIDSAKSALSRLGTSALSVGKTFYDVFTNGTGFTWLESSLELLRSMFGVVESISAAFSTVWNSGAGFENVTTLFTMFTNINGLIASIGGSFLSVFSNGTGAAIWENILGIITGVYNIVGNLAGSIQTAWDTAGLGDSIWQGILNIVNVISETIHDITDSIAEWVGTIDFTPLLTSIGTLLEAVELLTANIGAGLEWFWDNVLLPIAGWAIQDAVPTFLNMISAGIGSLNAVIEVFKPIGEWLWGEFLVPIGQWTGDLIISAMQTITGLLDTFTRVLSDNQGVTSLLTEVIDGLSGAWSRIVEILTPLGEFLSTVFADAWNNILTPALQFLGYTVLPKVTETFENLWNNVLVPLGSFLGDVLKPVIGTVSDVLSMLWKDVVAPLANAIGNVLAKAFNGICETFNITVIPITKSVIEVFQFLWKNVFSPIISFLDTTLKPVFSSVFKSIGKIVGDLSKIFGGLIDFIAGAFTGNWRKSWNGIKDIFSGIWNAFKDIVKTPINAIIGFINGLVSGVVSGMNSMINALNKLSFDVPDWVPVIGGGTFGFNIPNIIAPQIPYLANGAVLRGGNPFLAVVNDQKRGQTNVETPLKVIQEALREELTKFSAKIQVATPNMGMFNYEPTPVPSLSGAYGNYRYDTSAYTASYNGNNSDMPNAIEMAVYKATYNAVSSAIKNSKTLGDIKDLIEEGHVIEMDGREVSEVVRRHADAYTYLQGEPYFAF